MPIHLLSPKVKSTLLNTNDLKCAVERAVKLVSEASSQVEGEESRHGWILSVLEARRTRPAFDTKRDYHLI